MVVWGELQIAEKREVKGEGEKERYTHLNAEFQRIARRDKKAFLSEQCIEIDENNRMGKTEDLKKTRDTSTLATSWEELTHWKRLWCWEGLGAGGEGDDRGWDGWMASRAWWTWVWVNSGRWWWTGRPGMLRFMGSQRVGHDWATELNWTEGYQRNISCKDEHNKGQTWYGPKRSRRY